MNSKESFIVEFIANLQWSSLLVLFSINDEFRILLILVYPSHSHSHFEYAPKSCSLYLITCPLSQWKGRTSWLFIPFVPSLFQLIEISTIFVHFNYPWQSILINLRKFISFLWCLPADNHLDNLRIRIGKETWKWNQPTGRFDPSNWQPILWMWLIHHQLRHWRDQRSRRKKEWNDIPIDLNDLRWPYLYPVEVEPWETPSILVPCYSCVVPWLN